MVTGAPISFNSTGILKVVDIDNGRNVKYELGKKSGIIKVDRVLYYIYMASSLI
ncbi:hypothetical protein CASFOL_041144 [Castilleja foliolosa]|uniref:Uncharacterized protein n=1 Tax=Castilleja foliolosa TaxID=1961234 RepID=A0ABD3BE44_9LAMI